MYCHGGPKEPDAHDQTPDAQRRQLAHGAQADRAEEQFPAGVEKYTTTIHIGLTMTPRSASTGPPTSTASRRQRAESPTELRRARGSAPRRASHTHSQANSGARVMMNRRVQRLEPELGKLQPSIDVGCCGRRTGSALEPACSNSDQRAAPRKSTPITISCLARTASTPELIQPSEERAVRPSRKVAGCVRDLFGVTGTTPEYTARPPPRQLRQRRWPRSKALRRWRASRQVIRWSPDSVRRRRGTCAPERVLIRPSTIPTPAAANPTCQFTRWTKIPATSGAMNAPVLIPM